MTVTRPGNESPSRRQFGTEKTSIAEDPREKFRMITFDPEAHAYYSIAEKKKKTCSVVRDNGFSIAGEEAKTDLQERTITSHQPLQRTMSKCSTRSDKSGKLSQTSSIKPIQDPTASSVLQRQFSMQRTLSGDSMQSGKGEKKPESKKKPLQDNSQMMAAMDKNNMNYGATMDNNSQLNMNLNHLGGGFQAKKSKGCLACKSSLHCYMFVVATLCAAASVFFLVAVPFQIKNRYAEKEFIRVKTLMLKRKQRDMSKIWDVPKPQPMMDKLMKAWAYIAPYRGSSNGLYQLDYSMTEIVGNLVELLFCVALCIVCYLLMTKRFESHVESKRGVFRAQFCIALAYIVALAAQACVLVAQVGPRKKEARTWGAEIVRQRKLAAHARDSSDSNYQKVKRGLLNADWTAHDVRSWRECVRQLDLWYTAYRGSPRLYTPVESQIAGIIMLALFKVAILFALLFVSNKAFAKFKEGRTQKRAEQKKAQKQMQRQLEFHHAQNALIAQMGGKMHQNWDAMSNNSSTGLHSYATNGHDSMPIQGSSVWKNPDGSMGVSFTNPILAGMDMSSITNSRKKANNPMETCEEENEVSEIDDLESNE